MEYGADAVLDFLAHAGERGMLPAATASALAVACRTVFGVLEPDEKTDLRLVNFEGLVTRFNNKRARDFNPSSLKEYGRRVRRAWDLFGAWKADPANFAPKTRTTVATKNGAKRAPRAEPVEALPPLPAPYVPAGPVIDDSHGSRDVFSSSFPIRRGHVVTIANIPADLTSDEADRLAAYVTLLGAIA